MTQTPRSAGSGRDGGTHTTKAVVLIAVLVIIGLVVLNRTGSAKPAAAKPSATTKTTLSTSSTTRPGSTTSTTLLPPASIKLQVLNGVGSGSYASQWTAKLRANPGYNTLAPDDATAKVASSVIYVVTPGYEGEGRALAATVGLTDSAVDPSVPPASTAPIPPADRAKANLVLVIGPDLAGQA